MFLESRFISGSPVRGRSPRWARIYHGITREILIHSAHVLFPLPFFLETQLPSFRRHDSAIALHDLCVAKSNEYIYEIVRANFYLFY